MARARGVTAATVRRLALALPEAVEGSHFDHADFRVRNKIFASLPNAHSVTFKATPANVDALVSRDSATFRDAWAGRWVAARMDRIDETTLRELLHDAWLLVAPKKLAGASAAKPNATRASFRSKLWRYPGAGGWVFAPVPAKHAPSPTHGWGRTPVRATVEGHTWDTSVWRGKDGKSLLAVPKKVRGKKDHGDTVAVTIVLGVRK